MLVMSLEDYDEVTGKAAKAAIMQKDVVGKSPPVTHVASAEEGLLVSLDQHGRGRPALHRHALRQARGRRSSPSWATSSTTTRNRRTWQTADAYLSGNVRAKLAAAEAAGPAYARNAEALRAVQPEDVLPGDIDANLGAPWIPEQRHPGLRRRALRRRRPSAIPIGHLKKDAVWSVEADYAAEQSVAATSDTARRGPTAPGCSSWP